MKYYRNAIEVTTKQGVEVEAHSLWHVEADGVLVLDDEDQYATHPLDDNFYCINV